VIGAFLAGLTVAAADESPFETAATPTAETPIDTIVFRAFAKKGIRPRYCTDAVFVRRAYLDVIGTLPTAEEARAFIQDSSLNKRRALIDRLLERDEFADYWAMKWSDLLRVKAEFPIISGRTRHRPTTAGSARRSGTTSRTTASCARCSSPTGATSASAP
jgi:hypothetical protein